MDPGKPKMASSLNHKYSVCAVVVTWNTGKEIEQNISSVLSQVREVVIVDNGSEPHTIALLANIQKKFPSVVLLRNAENLGIAAALNRGVKYALEKEYDWILTLDDDSLAEPDMVHKMLAAYNSLPENERSKIGIIAPNYTIAKGLVYFGDSPRFVDVAITSGQLVKTEVFDKVGFYKEDLFIDGVDHEFCLRLLKFGYKTLLVPSAVLKQRMGAAPVLKTFFGQKFVVANHSAQRYYYIYRNGIYIYKTYWKYAPAYILKNMCSNLWLLTKIILFEQQKLEKLTMIFKGLIDGIRNKYGKLSS